MSEPRNRARSVETVVPGVLRWHLHDDRIDSESDAYAVQEAGRTVLVDPLPLDDLQIPALGRVEAICLTGSCHQRSAWRYRKRFGANVYAPAGAVGLDEKPDVEYRAGDALPGGLRAVHAPGPTEVHYALLLEHGAGVLFCADVLTRSRGTLGFVPAEYQDEPKRTRETARRFLDLEFAVLCPSHGAPITSDPKAAIRKILAADAGV